MKTPRYFMEPLKEEGGRSGERDRSMGMRWGEASGKRIKNCVLSMFTLRPDIRKIIGNKRVRRPQVPTRSGVAKAKSSQ